MTKINKKNEKNKSTKDNFNFPTIYKIYSATKNKLNRFFNKLYIPTEKVEDVTFNSYLEKVDTGAFKRRLCMGVSDKTQGLFDVSLLTNPGCVTIGGQGSGKTTSLKSMLLTHYISNASNSFYLIIDASGKGAGDFSNMFHLSNVATAINDIKKLVPAISMIYNEMKKREEYFRKIGSLDNWIAKKANSKIAEDDPERESKIKTPPEVKLPANITKYEEVYAKYYGRLFSILNDGTILEQDEDFVEWLYDIDPLFLGKDFCKKLETFRKNPTTNHGIDLPEKPKEVAFLLVIFEEFHVVLPHKDIDFVENRNTEGTIAYQLKQIARTGRSYGISLFVSTQRATFTEIHPDLNSGMSNALAHRMKNSSDASVYGLEHASQIKSTEIGRAAHEMGFFQSIYFPDKTQDELLKKYQKEFDSILFGNTIEEYKKVLSYEGSDGLVETSDYSYLILNSKLFDRKKILDRFLKIFDFHPTEEKYPSTEISAIYTRDGKRYAIYVSPEKSRSLSYGQDKSFENFKKEVGVVTKVDGVIVLSFDSLSSDQTNFASQNNGYALDKEDLLKIGRIVDAKEESTKLGIFESLYNQIPIAKRSVEPRKEKDLTEDDIDDIFGFSKPQVEKKKKNDLLDREKDFMRDFSNLKPSRSRSNKSSSLSDEEVSKTLNEEDESEDK